VFVHVASSFMGIDFLMRIIAFQEGKGKGFEGGGQPSDKIHPADF